MELLVEMHGFKRWWKAAEICDGCLARNPACINCNELTFMNFAEDAPWRATVLDHQTYMAQEEVISPFAIVDGFNYEMCFRDWAHMDALGYGRDFGGATIKSMLPSIELASWMQFCLAAPEITCLNQILPNPCHHHGFREVENTSY